MIMVTRLNGVQLVVNAELIEFVEATPDTILTLTTGRKLVVTESVDVILNLVLTYKRSILAGPAKRRKTLSEE